MLRFLYIETTSKYKIFHVFPKNHYTLYLEKVAKTLVKSGIFANSAIPIYTKKGLSKVGLPVFGSPCIFVWLSGSRKVLIQQ